MSDWSRLFIHKIQIMKTKVLFWHDFVSLRKLSSLIFEGKSFLGDSDTVLGLFAPATQKGVLSLNEIKGRQEKPYILLIFSQKDIETYVDVVNIRQVENILAHCWPGPLTVIFKAKSTIPDYLRASNGTIALRVPKHEELRQLLALTGPLFSTSANKTGQPVPINIKDVDSAIVAMCDYVVLNEDKDGQSGKSIVPSTIIDVTGDQVVIVREGQISKHYLESLII